MERRRENLALAKIFLVSKYADFHWLISQSVNDSLCCTFDTQKNGNIFDLYTLEDDLYQRFRVPERKDDTG